MQKELSGGAHARITTFRRTVLARGTLMPHCGAEIPAKLPAFPRSRASRIFCDHAPRGTLVLAAAGLSGGAAVAHSFCIRRAHRELGHRGQGAAADAPDRTRAGEVLGFPNARNVIEYASMTCPHCAHFSQDDISRTEEALHRHRVHLPRISVRQGRRRRIEVWRAVHAQEQRQRHTVAVVETLFAKRWSWSTSTRCSGEHRQTTRLLRRLVQSLPDKIRRC